MDKRENNFISAVVYIRNDEDRLEDFIHLLNGWLSENFKKYEIIFVNDFSSDGSMEVIKRAAADLEGINVSVIHMSHFHGNEMAMSAGIDMSIGDFVYEFDSVIADYEPDVIRRIYDLALEGNDIVMACPDGRQRLTSRTFYYWFAKLSGQNDGMRTERFRIISRRALNRVHSMNRNVSYRKAVYANCGLKTEQFLYTASDKGGHKEKEVTPYRMNLAMDSFILFTEAGYKIASRMTIGMMLVAFFCAVYTVGIFLTGNAMEGWTTTMLFLSFVFFGLFAILTFVMKYLSVIVRLIFYKHNYNYESVEKITG